MDHVTWKDMKAHFCDAVDFVGRQAGRIHDDAPRIIDEYAEPICGKRYYVDLKFPTSTFRYKSTEQLHELLNRRKEPILLEGLEMNKELYKK